MIPYDIDPSLHTCEPEPPMLGDGFSPPRGEQAPAQGEQPAAAGGRMDPAPGANSGA